MTQRPAIIVTAVTLLTAIAFTVGALTGQRTVTRTVVPVACTRAAHEAQTVISHNQRLGGLIDYLQAPASHRLVIGDNLPAFDHRTPDLEVCR